MFKKIGINTNPRPQPIIHFRCSDVPFEKNNHYPLQKFQYYYDSIKEIKSKGINVDEIMILYNNTHRSNDKNGATCNTYVEMLREYIRQNLNIHTKVYSRSSLEDFADIFYAPAVISTSGSFSFMSGFFGDGYFIAPCVIDENLDVENISWLKTKYMIHHNIVNDFYDIDEIRQHFYSNV